MTDLEIADVLWEAISEFDDECPKRGCSKYLYTDCAPCNIKIEIGELRGSDYWDVGSDSEEEEEEEDVLKTSNDESEVGE